jgi:ribonuclease Z
MFDVIFLGTSASTPSIHRGLSAHMVLHRQYRFLIDCGEGTQRQILRSGLGFRQLNTILLTHSHLDHVLGLGGLMSTLGRWETLGQIDIYAGQPALDRVADLLFHVVWRNTRPPVEINLIPLHPGMVIVEDEKFHLSAFPVTHRGSGCYGFLFAEKARRPFLAEKAAALGVPFGPERGRLVQGKSITLADGRTIRPDDVLGDPIPGTKYVHIGDVGRTNNLREVCHQADAITIEATYQDEDADLAARFGHLTAGQAARLARDVQAKALLLTHISRRYYEQMVRQEAQLIFPDAYVARDYDHFQVVRGGVTRLRNRRHQYAGDANTSNKDYDPADDLPLAGDA